MMARFGPRANGPPIFGPGQAGPIYKRRTGPKWAEVPSRAPGKPAWARPKRAGSRPDTSLFWWQELSKENSRINNDSFVPQIDHPVSLCSTSKMKYSDEPFLAHKSKANLNKYARTLYYKPHVLLKSIFYKKIHEKWFHILFCKNCSHKFVLL